MSEDVQERPTPDEVAESLTGFDELAIEAKFNRAVSELDGTRMLRAMAFTLHRRAGMADKDAYLQSMQATLKAVTELFRQDGADAAADEEAEEGKGAPVSAKRSTRTS